MKTTLSKPVFSLLYKAVLDECNKVEGFQTIGKGEALFGFGRFDGKKEKLQSKTINSIMQESSEVNSVLAKHGKTSFNAKYLYDRVRDLRNPNIEEITLIFFYQEIYLQFVGFENLDKFLNQLPSSPLPSGNISQSIQSTEKSSINDNWHYYQGNFYNAHSNAIHNYQLNIDPKNKQAELTGIHQSILDGSPDPTKYFGKIELLQGNLRIEFQSEANKEDKITFILYCGESESITKHKFLRGIYLTITKQGMPFSAETILSKFHNELNPSDLLIKRYLNLERKYFSLPKKEILADSDLRPKNKSLEILKPLAGFYKVWSFSFFSKEKEMWQKIRIYKSKFVIYNDFRAELTSAYGHLEESGKITLPCWIWVADDLTDNVKGNRKLSITSYRKDSFDIKSHAMVEIPNQMALHSEDQEGTSEINNLTTLKGVYCSFGTQTRDFLASAVIFEKIGEIGQSKDQAEFINFKPRSFKLNEITGKSDKKIYAELLKHYNETTIQAKPK